jgi:trans-2,3-dihydro-3-hydroxyanthranilate isomerase
MAALEVAGKCANLRALQPRKPARMAALDYHVLDVFTTARFSGNPLAVVLDADSLDGQRMQTIAREFNLSETIFVLKPTHAAHTARVRIFTPAAEMPFAGHPTVGAACLLAQLRPPATPETREALVVLEEAIGLVRVGVRLRPGSAPYAEFDAPRLPEELPTPPPVDRLAAAVGLIPAEVGFENHRPTRYSAGNAFTFVPVASLDSIGKAQVSRGHWEAAMEGGTGAFLYCRQTTHTTSAFHARMFAPDHGVAEDPATGSAAAAFAAIVHRFDELPDGAHKRVIEQGFEMGRPSLIELSVTIEGGKLTTVRIGGHAVRVATGRIEI